MWHKSYIHALKQMSIFQKNHVAIELDNETLGDSDECLLSEDIDGLDSNGKETSSNSGYRLDEESVEIAEKNVDRFEIHTGSYMPLSEGIETEIKK